MKEELNLLHKIFIGPTQAQKGWSIMTEIKRLIAAAVVFFADASLFEIPLASLWQKGEMALCWQGIVIFAAVLIARLRFKVPMIWVLAGSAAAGYLLFLV